MSRMLAFVSPYSYPTLVPTHLRRFGIGEGLTLSPSFAGIKFVAAPRSHRLVCRTDVRHTTAAPSARTLIASG